MDLNKDDTQEKKHLSEKTNTPIFSLLNNDSLSSLSSDLDGFNLGPAGKSEDKNFSLNEDFHMKISTNLSFLKSVNQMPVHLEKGGKNDTEANNFPLPKHEAFKKKETIKTEITDYVLMKKGYLEGSYYIYRICSRIDDKNGVVVERRYSDFEWLHTYLSNHPRYQGLLIPKLPDKHGIGASFFNYLSSDAEFIKKRKSVIF